MKLGHIQYKVNNLDNAVSQLEDMGFIVEYGSGRGKSFNAIVWFKDGPFLEFFSGDYLESEKMKIIMVLAKIIGRKNLIYRMENYRKMSNGFCDLCIESEKKDLIYENKILDKYMIEYNNMKGRRKKGSGEKLFWDLCIPKDIYLPFLMSAYNIPQKPDNIVHPNGAVEIEKLIIKSNPDRIPILRDLVEDERLDILEVDNLEGSIIEDVKIKGFDLNKLKKLDGFN